MSNSIWKTPDQKPEERRQILFYAGCGGLLNKGWYYTKNDAFGSYSSKNVQKWAYIDELFAQANKAERLQKAVNTALISLGTAAILDRKCVKKYTDAKIDLIKQLIKED